MDCLSAGLTQALVVNWLPKMADGEGVTTEARVKTEVEETGAEQAAPCEEALLNSRDDDRDAGTSAVLENTCSQGLFQESEIVLHVSEEEACAPDEGYERLDSGDDDQRLGEGLTQNMPQPPPPTPTPIKSPSEEKDKSPMDDMNETPYSKSIGGFADTSSMYDKSIDKVEDILSDTTASSDFSFSASSTDKIVINLPGKSKPKSPKPAPKDTASAWLDFEDTRLQSAADDIDELVLDLGELEPDRSDEQTSDEKNEKSGEAVSNGPPARPSAPPARPSAPPSQKPNRPPPPRPVPPKKNWETFDSGPPSRPPPPKITPKQQDEPDADDDSKDKKSKTKLGISTKKLKGVLDKSPLKSKSGKKDKKDKDVDLEDLTGDEAAPVSKDTEQWKEFEAMQQRITASVKQSQDKVSAMESGFEPEIKKLDIQAQSPWAVAQAGPGSEAKDMQPVEDDKPQNLNLMDDKKTTWVGFEDNFEAAATATLCAKAPHLNVTPIPSPKLPMTPNNSARGSSEDLAQKADATVDLLGLSDGVRALAEPTECSNNDIFTSLTGDSKTGEINSDLIGIDENTPGGADLNIKSDKGDESGVSAVALGIVDEFLGVDAVKAVSEEIITDPLKKLELMKGKKEKDEEIPNGQVLLDDDDPFGLGTSVGMTSSDVVSGDLFILEDHEKQESDKQPQQPKADDSLTKMLASPSSDDFDPRADISAENLNVKPASDTPAETKPSKSVDKSLARPRPKAAAKAENPFNLVLDVEEAPAIPADEGPNLLGDALTNTNPFTSSEGGFSSSNPFASAAGDVEDGAKLFDVGKDGETQDGTSTIFNPFATITEGDSAHPTDSNQGAFDPFQTIHDDDAFDLNVAASEENQKPVDDGQEAVSPTRFNPFDKEPPLDEKFAKFEPEHKSEEKPDSSAASTHDSLDIEEEEVEPLPPFYPPFEGDGWNLLLRQPIKKKLTQNRFWKPVYVRFVMHKDIPTLKVFNNDKEAQPLHELPLQQAYQLCNMGLQQYDQFGKCHTVKVQYVFYKERVGVKAERITPTLSDLTRVRNLKGLKDLVHRPKTTMILDHSPQTSELLKFGALNYDDIRTFIREIEDALFHLKCGRDSKSMQYTKDEITVDLVDEYYAEIDKDGHITFHKGRVRMFCLAFITGGNPWVEVGLNDKRRQGKEVVGRKDIVPIKTDEWIRMQDAELHSIIDKEEYEKSKLIKFVPLDACQFEIMRFRTRPRLNKELPLQIRCQMAVLEKHVEIRGDVMIPGYYSNSRRSCQTPCEDIQIRFPIPEPWFYMFRTEKRFRYGAVHSTTRKPGKIKGLERLSMMAQGMMPPSLIEVSKGTAKFENVHRAIVWKIPKLPERNEEAYKTHLFVLKMDLAPHDVIPETFDQYITVEYSMPNSTVSRAQIRSIGVDCDEPPDRWCHHLAKYEYKVEIDFCDKPKAPNQSDVVMMPVAPTSPRSDEEEDAKQAEENEEDSDSSSDSSDSD